MRTAVEGAYTVALSPRFDESARFANGMVGFLDTVPSSLGGEAFYRSQVMMPQVIPGHVKYLRTVKGVGQHQLAREMTPSQSIVSALENRERHPNLRILGDIYKALGAQALCLLLVRPGPPYTAVAIPATDRYSIPVGRCFAEQRCAQLYDKSWIADCLGRTSAHPVSRFENGKKSPGLATIAEYFGVLGITLRYCAVWEPVERRAV